LLLEFPARRALASLNCGTGGVTLIGTPGADTINGNSSNDSILAGGGNDTVHGNDYVDGGGTADTVRGGAGNDRWDRTQWHCAASGPRPCTNRSLYFPHLHRV
jgi:Ca2+-binding RTX toxin-like protein